MNENKSLNSTFLVYVVFKINLKLGPETDDLTQCPLSQ